MTHEDRNPKSEREIMTWIYGYCVTFNDGDPPEYQMLGEEETEEECRRIADLIPAICYTGSRPVREATFIWTPNSVKASSPQ
jgi:hypothetical protein